MSSRVQFAEPHATSDLYGAGCAKFAYPDKRAAASQRNRIRRERGAALRPYYCHACRAWHLTKEDRE